MYLEIGNDLLIESRAVLGVFDLDNTSWSKRTRAFLEAAQELPKSFVLTQEFGAQRVYLTKYNAAVLTRRFETARERAAYPFGKEFTE